MESDRIGSAAYLICHVACSEKPKLPGIGLLGRKKGRYKGASKLNSSHGEGSLLTAEGQIIKTFISSKSMKEDKVQSQN
jgi:hypothetical protein